MKDGVAASSRVDPWADRGELHRSVEDCRAVRESLLAKLSGLLDAVHGVPLGIAYWRVVMGPWLLYHLQQLEDRRRRLVDAPAPDCLGEADFIVPYDTADFHDVFQTDRYQLQLAALILKHLGRPGREVRPAPGPAKRGGSSGLRALLRGLRARAYAVARKIWPAEYLSDGIYPLGILHEELAKALSFRLWPVLDELPERLRVPAVFDERRLALSRLAADGDLESLAVSTLPWCLPSVFLEGFAAARAYARRSFGPAPRVMLHGPGIHYRDLYKLCAAEARREGATLVGFQHGGHYGFSLWSNAEWHERSVNDFFLTWGWSDGPRTIPVPVPWLSRPLQLDPARRDILLVTASGLKLPHELFALPLGEQWREFFSWRGRFLDHLGPAGRARTRLRLFPKDYGWDEDAQARRRWPDLRLDDPSVAFARSLSTAALVVTDHPGTTFLEAMAWDIPGVHFWDDAIWESRPEAFQALEPLRRAGIVHASPESAAEKIGGVIDDPRGWWSSPEVRAARAAFVSRHARTDPAWAAAWAEALSRRTRTPAGAHPPVKC